MGTGRRERKDGFAERNAAAWKASLAQPPAGGPVDGRNDGTWGGPRSVPSRPSSPLTRVCPTECPFLKPSTGPRDRLSSSILRSHCLCHKPCKEEERKGNSDGQGCFGRGTYCGKNRGAAPDEKAPWWPSSQRAGPPADGSTSTPRLAGAPDSPNAQERPGLRKGPSPHPCLWQVHGGGVGGRTPRGSRAPHSDISSSSINSKGGTGRL